ncbi:hypothetical protein LZ198_25015 [Myxococcus sp. K15C18031901]|uniref:hypothetical protein n=1 Tax=Myxococcus dinghuensis TaxID=2906761 RepID=UPI0020A70BCC|nr:hypothetical protein [Myxococcus dinghuensis]MCP3102134.1 hypothetical protein [Myxococcus dinghuensis]
MKTPRFPTLPVVFQLMSFKFFGGCTTWLLLEARVLGGQRGLMSMGVAVAAGALAVLSLASLVSLLRAREVVVLGSRSRVGTYVQVLGAMGLLGLLGVHLLHTEARPAFGVFCLGVGAWLAGIGLNLVPGLYLSTEGFIDPLGRRTRFRDLEWFTLQRGDGEPPRVVLQAGRGASLRLETRLPGQDADEVKRQLLQAGLASRGPSR